jgi:hypothetical protein
MENIAYFFLFVQEIEFAKVNLVIEEFRMSI